MSHARKVLERRRAATQRTVDHFLDKSFRPGRRDCGQLLAFHMKAIGRRDLVPPMRKYSTWKGARLELDRLGWSTVGDALQSLEQIPAAAALMGDVVEMPALETAGSKIAPMGGVGIAVGNGAVLCYVEGQRGAVIGRILEATRAWRVIANPGSEATGEGS